MESGLGGSVETSRLEGRRGASFTKVGTQKAEQPEGLGKDESQAGHFEFGVPHGYLGADIGIKLEGLPGIPAVASHLSASLRLLHPPTHQGLWGGMAALELLSRAVFQKARSASRGSHRSLPISRRSGPGPHLPCSDEQQA